MVSFPPCKINLGLRVLRKRADGYHDLDTCFYPLPFTDILEVIPSKKVEFTMSGLSIPGDGKDNLCLRAYHLMQEKYKVGPVKLHLHKIIPTGAGLGGGSADAAHTLRLLNIVFNLGLSQEQLAGHAAGLGSDCSFFIYDVPMIGSGRGEILTPSTATLAGKYLVLLNPSIHVSTAEAYAGIVPSTLARSVSAVLADDIDKWKSDLKNNFEASVFVRHPMIRSIKERLYTYGARYAAMSGSGSSVFGIFDNPVDIPDQRIAAMTIWKGLLPNS
jgi:4-diphosphocytidyl-2-C-methyl-D-erythritol kinase